VHDRDGERGFPLLLDLQPRGGPKRQYPDAQRPWLKAVRRLAAGKVPGQTLAQIRSSVWAGLSTPQDAFAEGRPAFGLCGTSLMNAPSGTAIRPVPYELQTAFYRQTYDYLKQTIRHRAWSMLRTGRPPARNTSARSTNGPTRSRISWIGMATLALTTLGRRELVHSNRPSLR